MVTIGFTGNIIFSSKYFKESWQAEDLFDQGIKDYLKEADYVVANVEAPMTSAAGGSGGSISHANPPESIVRLNDLNANIWNLANNHAMDCGPEGVSDTIALAEANGIRHFGAGMNEEHAGRIVELDEAGGIGMFGVVYYKDFLKAGADKPGCLTYDEPEKIKAIIEKIKARNRWCVLVVHGGEEFASMPLPYVRRLYHKFLEYGADVIVSHHSHTVQNYEIVGDKMIFYSLGNLVCDTDYQRLQKHTQEGMLIRLSFDEEKYTWDFHATKIDREQHKVVSSEPTAIFTNIGEEQFRKLWPLGAWNYCKTDRIASIYFNPHKADFTALQWIQNDISWFGKDIAMELLRGSLLYRLGLWRSADKKLVEYLLE